MEYVNLDLELSGYHRDSSGLENFCVHVVKSYCGPRMTSDKAVPVTLTAEQRRGLSLLKLRGLTKEEMIEWGEVLGKMLVPPNTQVWTIHNNCINDLKEGQRLRIRLTLGNYALSDLPWEFAYILPPDTPDDQKDWNGFLVLDKRISLVRYPATGHKMVSLDPVEKEKLRMVVIMANPRDYRKLEIKKEFEKIQDALKEVPTITPEPYPDATIQTLQDALMKPAHIFHFAGHGDFEGDLGASFKSTSGQGNIILSDKEGKGDKLPAGRLASLLRNSHVRVAALAACETGKTDQINAWTGVAPALIQAGIPAVVGMQFAIEDENAIAFSRQFYLGLAKGLPIDAAVAEGRQAIFIKGKEDEGDWGVPVLYLRAEEGILFPMDDIAAAKKGIRQFQNATAHDPEAFAVLCRSTEAIKITYDQLGELELFKTIHDALHHIEVECLENMKKSGPKYFITYQQRFNDYAEKIKSQIVVHKTHHLLEDLKRNLERVDNAFQSALAMDDPSDTVLENAASILNDMISRFLPRLDSGITNAASTLDLDRMVTLMTDVKSRITGHEVELLPKISGIDSLERLRSRLQTQVAEHYDLQSFDSELRMACNGKPTSTDVAKKWEHIKMIKKERFRPPFSRILEKNNAMLILIEGKIDAAITRGDYTKALEDLEGYFMSISETFRAVDSSLKDLCNELAHLRPELDSLLNSCREVTK